MKTHLLRIVVAGLLFLGAHTVLAEDSVAASLPFSTDAKQLTLWNGTEYVPFFLKGINLGVAVPGTFPGEMAATKADYIRWIDRIQEAGFNAVRLYTLHYPRFYDVLDSINRSHPEHPLFFIQGVWLNEESDDAQGDLFAMSDTFMTEIDENIDAVHGHLWMPERMGKAHGRYTTDASRWCMGYLIGREIYPDEVLATNAAYPGVDGFEGAHLGLPSGSPTEVWLTRMLDHTIGYEKQAYGMQRPVSMSSWPTLDPMAHAEEPNRGEDTVGVDLAKIQIRDAPAGVFASYHAYPYYPDFVGAQSSYRSISDALGPDSYLGYLNELKAHFPNMPLIIAEYGVPSSWTVAHYTSSGMNHGGFDEEQQGWTDIRLLDNVREAGCGGGIQFSWLDEWFKKTWIADPLDADPESRILWQNLASAEQNFGLVGFRRSFGQDTLLSMRSDRDIAWIRAEANTSFLELELGLKKPLSIPDELWLSLDTYAPELGERVMPDGSTSPTRAEFALDITNHAARLYVTQAYDVFGIWHGTSAPEQKYRSVVSDGAPWTIVRVRNNSYYSDVQYIGELTVNHDFQPAGSKDAVTLSDRSIVVRLPWNYLNITAPDHLKVLHDNRSTAGREDTVTDGVAVSVRYKGQWTSGNHRFRWNQWNASDLLTVEERLKDSYAVVKQQLVRFNTTAIAMRDSFMLEKGQGLLDVRQQQGLLTNDFDPDGGTMLALVSENPLHGRLALDNDGSFAYLADAGFAGVDSFQYCLYDGFSLSRPNTVVLDVQGGHVSAGNLRSEWAVRLNPNPCGDQVTVTTSAACRFLRLFDLAGRMVLDVPVEGVRHTLDLSGIPSGSYLLLAVQDDQVTSARLIRQ